MYLFWIIVADIRLIPKCMKMRRNNVVS